MGDYMNNDGIKKIIRSNIFRTVIIGIFILFGTLIIRKSSSVKNIVFNKVYNSYLSLAVIKNTYNKYLGNVLPFRDVINEKSVSSEKIKYKDISTYNKGIKLSLEDNYSIPVIKDGIVIYIGHKDDFNQTVIIEDENGIDMYYGNLSKVNVKIYDYVSKNDLLGSADNNELYMMFQKGEEYLDYKEFLD